MGGCVYVGDLGEELGRFSWQVQDVKVGGQWSGMGRMCWRWSRWSLLDRSRWKLLLCVVGVFSLPDQIDFSTGQQRVKFLPLCCWMDPWMGRGRRARRNKQNGLRPSEAFVCPGPAGPGRLVAQFLVLRCTLADSPGAITYSGAVLGIFQGRTLLFRASPRPASQGSPSMHFFNGTSLSR